MCTLLGTPPNLVIVYTALKPRHRRTLTIVIESVGKILLEKEKNKQLSKAAPSNVHRRTLKTPKKMKLIKFYLYLPDTPNTSRRVLRGVRAKMALNFSPNNQNITCKDVLIT